MDQRKRNHKRWMAFQSSLRARIAIQSFLFRDRFRWVLRCVPINTTDANLEKLQSSQQIVERIRFRRRFRTRVQIAIQTGAPQTLQIGTPGSRQNPAPNPTSNCLEAAAETPFRTDLEGCLFSDVQFVQNAQDNSCQKVQKGGVRAFRTPLQNAIQKSIQKAACNRPAIHLEADLEADLEEIQKPIQSAPEQDQQPIQSPNRPCYEHPSN